MTMSTMLAPSSCLFAEVTSAKGKRILLPASVEFLTGPGNSAAAVLSYADPPAREVVSIRLLTLCHICTGVFNAPFAATAVIF